MLRVASSVRLPVSWLAAGSPEQAGPREPGSFDLRASWPDDWCITMQRHAGHDQADARPVRNGWQLAEHGDTDGRGPPIGMPPNTTAHSTWCTPPKDG